MPDYHKYLKFFLTRTIVLYLLCFLVVWRLLNYDQLADNAIMQTMSRLTPPMDYFAEFVDKDGHYDRFKLMNCVNYHKAVAHFFNFQKAEAYGMLGFCYERLGEQPQATAAYQQAISLNPNYFWPYYDLGVIAYKDAQYPQAENYLLQALEQDPVKTVVLLSRSKVYNDVNLSRKQGASDYFQNLKAGRNEAYILLMDSLYKTNAYTKLWQVAAQSLKEDLDAQTNADALMYMGLCLKMANKTDMAQAFMAKAAQIHEQAGHQSTPNPEVRFF